MRGDDTGPDFWTRKIVGAVASLPAGWDNSGGWRVQCIACTLWWNCDRSEQLTWHNKNFRCKEFNGQGLLLCALLTWGSISLETETFCSAERQLKMGCTRPAVLHTMCDHVGVTPCISEARLAWGFHNGLTTGSALIEAGVGHCMFGDPILLRLRRTV